MIKQSIFSSSLLYLMFVVGLSGCQLSKKTPVSSKSNSVDDAVKAAGDQSSSMFLCGESDNKKKVAWNNIRKNGTKVTSGKSYDTIMSVLRRVPSNLMNKLAESDMEINLHTGAPDSCQKLSWIKPGKSQQRKFYLCYDVEVKGDVQKLNIHVGSIDDKEALDSVLVNPDLISQMKVLNIDSLDATELVLRHELIRTIGLYFVRYPRNTLSKIISVTPQTGTVGSGSKKVNLGQTKKINEMAGEALDKLNLQRNAILDALYLDIGRLANGGEVKKSFEKIKSAMVSAERFDDELLADVFDSYFCSEESRRKLESRFGGAKTAFENNFAVDL